MFIVALLTVANVWKQLKHPLVDVGIKKMHTMENYSVGKKEEILPFVMTWLNLDGIKWNKPGRERQILDGVIYIWKFSLKKLISWLQKQNRIIEWWISRAGRRVKWTDVSHSLCIFSYKSWGFSVQHGALMTLVKNTILIFYMYFKLDLKHSHKKKKKKKKNTQKAKRRGRRGR